MAKFLQCSSMDSMLPSFPESGASLWLEVEVEVGFPCDSEGGQQCHKYDSDDVLEVTLLKYYSSNDENDDNDDEDDVVDDTTFKKTVIIRTNKEQ